MKKLLMFLLIILMVLLGFYVFLNYYDSKYLNNNIIEKLEYDTNENLNKLKEKQAKINKCINSDIDITLLGDQFNNKVLEVDSFLKNYQVYVSYSELDDTYYYGYNDEVVIYGASLIKLVDALYILDNDIDINSTLKYSSNYYSKYKKGLTTHKVGDDLTIDTIVKHALALSDNGAHKMLIDYIGFSNLKKYGKTLGATVILTGGDNFGMQTAKDTNVYLNRLYDLTLENDNATKFKDYMINDFHSYLNVNNLSVAHKYGYYQDKFHDIGIVYDEHPYTISVLTKYGNGDYKNKINAKMKSDLVLLAYKNDILEGTKGLKDDKNIYIAAAMVVKYENTATIVASSFDKTYSRHNANYFLYYKIIEHYKNKVDFIDLNGMTGDLSKLNPFYGLNQFKLGFKPNVYEYIGEYDLIINENDYSYLKETGTLAKEFNKKND